MKKLILLAAVLIALMSFAWAQPAYATVPTGEAWFDVDCSGVTGHGVVPAGMIFEYDLALYSPDIPSGSYWTHVGTVDNTAGASDVAFNVVVPWPALMTSTDWYTTDIWNITGGGKILVSYKDAQLDCPPPPPPPPPGGAGCTPGYWRNHFEDWPPTGYSPSDSFDTVFGTSYFSPSYTLGDAIWQGGGGVKKVARHGTAALLNATHPSVSYPFTVAEVMAAVQAGNVDALAAANELGCSIR